MKLKYIADILLLFFISFVFTANASESKSVEDENVTAKIIENDASVAENSVAIESAKNGKKIYDSYCIRCHGPKMINPGTVTYDLRRFPEDQKTRFMNSVSKGIKQMPPWGNKLTEEEIELIWQYVLTDGKI